MRKFIMLLIAAIAFIGSANAQIVELAKVPATKIYWKNGNEVRETAHTLAGLDTTNAYMNATWFSNMYAKVTVTRTSGYQRVKVKLLGAVDSTGPWFTVRGTTTQCVPCADSLITTGNATTTILYDLRGFHFNYLRSQYISDTSTTASTTSFEVWGSH